MVELALDSQSTKKSFRWRPWTMALGVLLVAVGGYAAHQGWIRYRVGGYSARCQAAREASDWQAMRKAAESWAALDPSNAMPWLYLAEAAEGQGDLEGTAAHLAKLPDNSPKTVAALLERSNLLFGPLNRPFEAVATCERILRINPHTPEAHQRLIFFYAATLQRTKVIAQARTAIEFNCDTPETYVYLIGADWMNLSNGYELNTRWLENHPAEELFLVAREIQYVRSRGIDEMIDEGEADALPAEGVRVREKELNNYLRIFPQNTEILAYFLDRNSDDGHTGRVAEILAQAPESAVDDNRFWRFKGWLHAAQGEVELADAAYRKALLLNPFDWASQHQLAGVLRKRDSLAEVERLSQLSLEGKELRKAIVQLPDVQSVPRHVLLRMAAYVKKCGENDLARRIYAARPLEAGKPNNSN
jgi:tetratricopeptide (TPR) repeat protein